jgi:hypothetical protein
MTDIHFKTFIVDLQWLSEKAGPGVRPQAVKDREVIEVGRPGGQRRGSKTGQFLQIRIFSFQFFRAAPLQIVPLINQQKVPA